MQITSIKYLIPVLTLVFILSSVSAIPQVVFSDINMSIWSNQTTVGSGNQTQNITTGNYRILGEGISAVTTFEVIGNCTFNYVRDKIPITFSREFQQNDSDIATLIHSLAINNNLSQDWKNCTINLASCMNDVGYKGNYTLKAAELEICYRARDDYSKQVNDLNEQIKTLTTWRNIGMIIGVASIIFIFYNRRKTQIKIADNPYNAIPSAGAQY